MKCQVAVFMGALVLVGCGSVRYPKTYTLNLPLPPSQPSPSTGALGPVAIREFRCPEYLCEGRLVYRSSPEEIGFYEYHRWAADPRKAITQYVEDGLRAQSLFESVGANEHGSDASYLLTGSVEQLEEVDQGHEVRVVCTIAAQLLDARTKSVLWSRRASESVKVEKRDMPSVVSSLSAAARTAADRLLKSIREEVPANIAVTRTERESGSHEADGREGIDSPWERDETTCIRAEE